MEESKKEFEKEYQNKCQQFLKSRSYYGGQDYLERFHKYLEYIENFDTNLPIPHAKQNIIRLMSWNIRYFTDIYNVDTSEEIFNKIIEIKPDIICFQEFTLGWNKYSDINDFAKNYKNFLNGYKMIAVCSAIPSWYADLYGNAIFMHHDFISKIINSDETNNFYKYICDPTKCTFNQHIANYSNIPEKNIMTINEMKFIDYKNSNENKCFIKISIHPFDIFCIHLDAYSVKMRNEQLDIIANEITRTSIIIGDFNFFNPNDFFSEESKKELEYHQNFFKKMATSNESINDNYHYIIEKLGWIDISDGQCVPNFSQWAGTRVDHAFLANPNGYHKDDLKMYYIASKATDHIPFFLDIKFDYQLIESKIGSVSNLLFNCQPITMHSLDWIINNKFTYINDPFLTGSSEENKTLGILGIYMDNRVDQAIGFGRKIIDYIGYNYPNNIMLLFVNKKNQIPCIYKNIIKTSSANDQFNIDHDVLIWGTIEKFTPRSFDDGIPKCFDIVSNNIIALTKIDPGTKNSFDVKYRNKEYIEKYQSDIEKYYQILKNKLNKKSEKELEENDPRKIYFNIFRLLVIADIYREEYQKQNMEFSINFDEIDFIENLFPNQKLSYDSEFSIVVEYKIISK